ncbi:hypothetical protein [uncultured Corynebacterium sp.]|uniref:hypothetical protein n=1 Tax=uncultured Corynebacterium sp. TaxID=159447 RepID=UPI0025E1CC14|nr:hypothetical protein [uncultured Corynebacterium sp.]
MFPQSTGQSVAESGAEGVIGKGATGRLCLKVGALVGCRESSGGVSGEGVCPASAGGIDKHGGGFLIAVALHPG